MIRRHWASPHVDHEENRVRLLNRGLRLHPHSARKTFWRRLLETRRINHRKSDIAEPPLALATIACDAGAIVDQGQAPPDKAIEQG